MNNVQLMDAIGGINEKYIEKFAYIKPVKRNTVVKRILPIAACVAIIMTMAITTNLIVSFDTPVDPSPSKAEYCMIDDIDAVIYNDTRRNQPFNYPEIEKMPDSMPVYKLKYIENSTDYMQNVANSLGFNISKINIENNNMLSENGFLSYSSGELGGESEHEFTRADILTAYNNGSFYLSLVHGKETDLLGLSLLSLSNEQLVERMISFIENYSFLDFSNPKIEIIENSGAFVHLKIWCGDESDKDKILAFNGLMNTLEIISMKSSFTMYYSTGRYYEIAEQKDICSYDEMLETAKNGGGTISNSLTEKFWFGYDNKLFDENDPVIGAYLIYTYDSEGFFRPVWTFEKEAVKTEFILEDGSKQYRHYFVFVDPLTISETDHFESC